MAALTSRGIVGIDLGTSSAKALIMDEQGKTLGVGRADYPVLTPQPGWAESDPAAWWEAVISAVHAAMAQAGQSTIIAIGLAGQMHGVVLVDDRGQALRPALLWPDSRAVAELERYRALSWDALQHLANPLAPGMAGPLLCWLAHREPQTCSAARWALQPKDWLRMCLTGFVAGAASDPSDASATLLYDLPKDGWADDVIAALGLRRDLFPPIVPSGSPAGPLSARAAGELGLPVGLPVATGAADTAAAALGAGLLSPGPIQLTLGTGAQFVQLCAEPAIDPTLRTHLYRAADGVHWFRMAAVQNAGLALDWARRAFSATWDELYACAGMSAAGLFFFPYLTPERFIPDQRGSAFVGMHIDHGREHLLHAALEGVAFGIRAALEMLPGVEAGGASALRLAGGGSVHPAWRQMLADALARELLIVDAPDASARGAALLGGIAAGVWDDAAATASCAPRISGRVVPDAGWARMYGEVYEAWSQIARP